MTDTYAERWNGYWQDLAGQQGTAMWDSAAGDNAALQLPVFLPHLDAGLPLLDIGCGNGTQTLFFGAHFGRVIGLDHAGAAIELASRRAAGEGVQFRRFDILDREAVDALHGEIGDANVYMRGVLHQMAAPDRVTAVAAVAALLGTRGRLYSVELTPASGGQLAEVADRLPGGMAKMQLVFKHGLTPAAWDDGELERLCRDAGLVIVEGGPAGLPTTERFADGKPFALDARWAVVKPAGS